MYGKFSKSIFWKAHCISCCHYVSLSQKYKSLPMSTREIKTPGLFWYSTFCYDWRNWSRWEKKHRNVLDQLLRLKAVGFPLKCPRQYPETSRNPSDTFRHLSDTWNTAYYTNKKPPISKHLPGDIKQGYNQFQPPWEQIWRLWTQRIYLEQNRGPTFRTYHFKSSWPPEVTLSGSIGNVLSVF